MRRITGGIALSYASGLPGVDRMPDKSALRCGPDTLGALLGRSRDVQAVGRPLFSTKISSGRAQQTRAARTRSGEGANQGGMRNNQASGLPGVEGFHPLPPTPAPAITNPPTHTCTRAAKASIPPHDSTRRCTPQVEATHQQAPPHPPPSPAFHPWWRSQTTVSPVSQALFLVKKRETFSLFHPRNLHLLHSNPGGGCRPASCRHSLPSPFLMLGAPTYPPPTSSPPHQLLPTHDARMHACTHTSTHACRWSLQGQPFVQPSTLHAPQPFPRWRSQTSMPAQPAQSSPPRGPRGSLGAAPREAALPPSWAWLCWWAGRPGSCRQKGRAPGRLMVGSS
jgi:hypothetical protein